MNLELNSHDGNPSKGRPLRCHSLLGTSAHPLQWRTAARSRRNVLGKPTCFPGNCERRLSAGVFVFMFGGLFDNVAVACKDRLLPDTFFMEELADYENVYVVHVQKVVPSKPLAESWYMPPFTFEGKILKSFKGNQKPGADI